MEKLKKEISSIIWAFKKEEKWYGKVAIVGIVVLIIAFILGMGILIGGVAIALILQGAWWFGLGILIFTFFWICLWAWLLD